MTTTPKSTAALIVAAGRGTRAGPGQAKQWRVLRSETIVERSLNKFRHHPEIGVIMLVLNRDDLHWAQGEAQFRDVHLVEGGDTRVKSVAAGLAALAPLKVDQVLIHDVARPLVNDATIERVMAALDTHPAAAPALPVSDALWQSDGVTVDGAVSRDGLFRAQTPQGFHYGAIMAAHDRARGTEADDVEIARAAGLSVAVVQGDEDNIKITFPEDFARAERILESTMDIRVGNGFDVHAFGPGDHVTLCGVQIEHSHGLSGHSDADVAMHTVTDAIYGALSAGDIGQHFPPSDDKWKGAASEIFLRHAVEMARARGFEISHMDVTLICETPKIGPHCIAMRTEMARIMGLEVDRVSVKATTSERLGFTGRKEGIAAMATVTLVQR